MTNKKEQVEEVVSLKKRGRPKKAKEAKPKKAITVIDEGTAAPAIIPPDEPLEELVSEAIEMPVIGTVANEVFDFYPVDHIPLPNGQILGEIEAKLE